jgi:uncharacterized membrane protein
MNAWKPLLAMTGIGLLLDGVWLTLRNKYHQSLFQSIQHSPIVPRILPAIAIYLLIPLAVYLTAVQSATTVHDGLLKGALTGAVLYAFYDLTNYATFTNWTLQMTVVDVLWGTFLCALVAAVGVYVKK